MATHSSILAWRILWTEKPGKLQFMGSQRVGHDLATKPPHHCAYEGFSDSSVGQESVCNERVPGLTPGSGRSSGEGIGYPLQYSWASLVARLVKNLPAMRETWVWSLVWEDPLEKGKTTHSSILAWRIPWTVSSTGSQRVRHDRVTFTLTVTPCIVVS